MAQRDKSQGFGFVYVDLAKILADRDKLDKESFGPVPATGNHINFNKDTNMVESVRRVPAPQPAPVATPQATTQHERSNAIQQIRENLDRLQTLHHKLHAMLDELNHVTDKKKK